MKKVLDPHGTSGCIVSLSKEGTQNENSKGSIRTNRDQRALYDDKALETLQQILFFREFDIPLREIKAIMDDPEFDQERTLTSQKRLLELKRDRLDRLIDTIDDILKGENSMNFEVFSQTDIEEMCDLMLQKMSDKQKDIFKEQYGSLESFKEEYLQKAGSKKAQDSYQKMVEWYGSKEDVMDSVKSNVPEEIFHSYQKRSEALYKKLAEAKGKDVHSFEVKQIIGELDFVSKQLYQLDDVSKLMLDLAELYEINPEMIQSYDTAYGDGAAKYVGEAIRAFYS